MANKYLIDEKGLLIKSKLASLSKKLIGGYDAGVINTQEDLLVEATRILTTFYKTLNEPNFIPPVFIENDLPDPVLYNQIWEDILDDLIVIFNELENLENVTLANYNFVSTEANRLMARLKNTSSMLGDYILYSSIPTRDAFFFKDSFNDLSRIEINSSLINSEECSVNQDEGIVTLPIDYEKNSKIIIKHNPIINPNSNGFAGNSQQLGAKYNGDPSKMLDDNPDSWFEYEKIVLPSQDIKEPLFLDMTLNLGDEKIVNHIRLNPHNFGTKTVILIEDISTSLDGRVYTSIKDDIPISNFLTEDEQNIFILAPSSSKYSGQGIFTFTPRKCKYIHIILKQTEPYIIETINGQRLRYAIGIRDIDVRGFAYKTVGEFISKPFSIADEIRKVSLEINQNPTEESSLVKMQYFISPDDGQTWNQIAPKHFVSTTSGNESNVSEILNFNGMENNSITTSVPVHAIRFKTVMLRNDYAFKEGASFLHKEVKRHNELHEVPKSAPFTIELNYPPVEGAIQIIDPMFGSKGDKDTRHILGKGQTTYCLSNQYNRPLKKVAIDGFPITYKIEEVSASNWIHVLVGGEEWQHANMPLTSYNANYSSDPQYKLFTYSNGLISFGTGENTIAPSAEAPVSIYFEPEFIYPDSIPGSHVANLECVTSDNKNRIKVRRYEAEQIATAVFPQMATRIQLEHKNITDYSEVIQQLANFGYSEQVSFINGRDELIDQSHWSIDINEGIIYLREPTPIFGNISIEYKYRNIVELLDSDWDFANYKTLRNAIKIKDSGWKTEIQENLELPFNQGVHQFELAHLAIVKGSVSFKIQNNDGEMLKDYEIINSDNVVVKVKPNPFIKEIPYIDGKTELGLSVKSTVQTIGNPSSVDSIVSIKLNHKIVDDLDYVVTFSNRDAFVTQIYEMPTHLGEYFIDRDPGSPTYNTVFVKVDYNGAPPHKYGYGLGKLWYYRAKAPKPDQGLYSINYATGQVYTQRGIPAQISEKPWRLTTTYQYTDYRVQYDIARLVKNWQYDKTENTIEIASSEILLHKAIIKDESNKAYYQINYDYVSATRESIEELKDYFTPVIKDYMLKIITKNRLL